MTVIVGVQKEDYCILGGDRMVSVGGNYISREKVSHKVFKRGGFIFGFTGTSRDAQILNFEKHGEGWDFNEKPEDIDYFMHTEFIEWIKNIYGKNKRLKTENEIIGFSSGCFLAGCFGKLYYVGPHFSVSQYKDSVYAIGCGWEFAYGAMFTSKNEPPMTMLENGLKAASYYSAYINEPFDFVESYKELK